MIATHDTRMEDAEVTEPAGDQQQEDPKAKLHNLVDQYQAAYADRVATGASTANLNPTLAQIYRLRSDILYTTREERILHDITIDRRLARRLLARDLVDSGETMKILNVGLPALRELRPSVRDGLDDTSDNPDRFPYGSQIMRFGARGPNIGIEVGVLAEWQLRNGAVLYDPHTDTLGIPDDLTAWSHDELMAAYQRLRASFYSAWPDGPAGNPNPHRDQIARLRVIIPVMRELRFRNRKLRIDNDSTLDRRLAEIYSSRNILDTADLEKFLEVVTTRVSTMRPQLSIELDAPESPLLLPAADAILDVNNWGRISFGIEEGAVAEWAVTIASRKIFSPTSGKLVNSESNRHGRAPAS